MGRPLPPEPMIFLKPDSALLKKNKPFFLPDFSKNLQFEAEVVLRISRLGKGISAKYANRYYDALTVRHFIRRADPGYYPIFYL